MSNKIIYERLCEVLPAGVNSPVRSFNVEKANVIVKPVQKWLQEHNIEACVQQVGSMFSLFFGKKSVKNLDDARGQDFNLFASFFRFMYDHGIYLPPSQHEALFVSTAHEERHLEKTRDLTLQFLKQEL